MTPWCGCWSCPATWVAWVVPPADAHMLEVPHRCWGGADGAVLAVGEAPEEAARLRRRALAGRDAGMAAQVAAGEDEARRGTSGCLRPSSSTRMREGAKIDQHWP